MLYDKKLYKIKNVFEFYFDDSILSCSHKSSFNSNSILKPKQVHSEREKNIPMTAPKAIINFII